MEGVASRPWLLWAHGLSRPSRGKWGFPELHTPCCTLHAACPLSLFRGKDARPRERGGPECGPQLHMPKPCKRHRDPHFLSPPLCGPPSTRPRKVWPYESDEAP